MNSPSNFPQTVASTWSSFSKACVSTFHRYASWLVSISWKRFFLLSILLIIVMGILHDIPPFSWQYTEMTMDKSSKSPKTPNSPKLRNDASKTKPNATPSGRNEGVDFSIDEKGVHIRSSTTTPAAPAPAAPAAPASAMAEPKGPDLSDDGTPLPPGADVKEARKAQADARRARDEARREFEEAMEEIRQEAKQTALEAAEALNMHVTTHKYGEPIMPLTMWFILLSGIIKVTYKGRIAAEAKAAQATEVAESESLKRQVIEARMAAMQAQVEPHFLFNTLASIDHLIETDPPRASIMQKNLIALLRASMPTMREANAQSSRDLGRELAVIRPYLEILKVRMEERLQTELRVSEGLYSAEFPPMMLQSLVENAIKHGLEPKAEGGHLTVTAEIVHGKLAVTVADTGLGFGKAATAGTGIGLSNIRERLALLYGGKASLTIKETPGGGTSVTITVPYVARTEEDGPASA